MTWKPFLILFISTCVISCNSSNFGTAKTEGKRLPINQSIEADSKIEEFIEPYKEHINKTLDSTIAYNPTRLSKTDGELNTAIGNLMADIVWEQANPIFKSRTGNSIDIVLLNQGGIRSTIEEGPVTARTAYGIMPFENEIVIAELSGEKINEMLTYLENNRTAHPISGLNIRLSANELLGATVNGEPVEESKNYFVATSDYLQQGGDGMDFFSDPENLYRIDYKIRNAIIDYFHKVDTLKAIRDDRYIQIN